MSKEKSLLKSSTSTLILTLLSRQSLYGYELIKELERQSDGLFQMKEGTLYPILHTMEAEGWIVAHWQEVEGRQRKYYQLTPNGSSKLQEKKVEWNRFSRAVNLILKEDGL